MNWFDPTIFQFVAHAAEGAAGPTPGFGLPDLLLIVGFIAIFYFLIFRPQSKRRKEHMNLMSSLETGNEVVTAGGIVGEVTKVEEDFIRLKVSDGVSFRMQKSSIVATLPKGTLKGLGD